MNNKEELRKLSKQKRICLNISEISEQIVSNIRATSLYKEAKDILLYYPLKYEVNLLSLLNDDKKFYLPRVKGQNLEICPYSGGDELKRSSLGIYEPVCIALKDFIPDIIFLPALAADCSCNRLGYGGGYYDRFLFGLKQKNNEVKAVIVIPEQLIIPKVPICSCDIVCDGFVTQKKASV